MRKKKNIDTQKEIEEFFKDDDIKEEKSKVKPTVKKEEVKEEQTKQENIEKMLQTISNNKKIPKNILQQIYHIVFSNLIMAIIIMAYLFFIILGSLNIEKDLYEIDLKVFTGLLFLATIILMEIAYKKKNKKIAVNGIEILCLSILNLFFLYFYTIFNNQYKNIIGAISLSFGLYYMIKSIVIFIIMRNNYLRTMSDVFEILNQSYDKEESECQEV